MNATDLSRTTVIGLCGTANANSSTRRVLEVALSGATEKGARAVVADLAELDLPFAGRAHDPEKYPDVAKLLEQVRGAQAVIWATPEYHGSFTGILKNALDLMGFTEYEGKMIGLIGVGGGSIGAINALTHLRTVGRQLHAWVLPQQVSVARVQQAFGSDGVLQDAELETRLKELGRDVARFAQLHSTAASDFVRQWEQAQEKATDS